MEAIVRIIIQAIAGIVGGGVVAAIVKQAIALVPRLIVGAGGGGVLTAIAGAVMGQK